MWQRKGGAHAALSVAVNVSVEQLRPGFPRLIETVLRRHQFEPSCLTIEVTESMLVHEETTGIRVLREVSDLGVKIAVDDFGTGYSALHRMRQFPVDVLKIDRSFVSQLGEGAGDPLITAMIALGHGMGLRVVAEGIESPHQLQFLAEHQCDLGQGYLLCAPLPADKIEAMLGGTVAAFDALPAVANDRPLDRLAAELLPLIATAMRTDVELENLARPMLTKLAEITGLESTYITAIDWEAGTQSIEIARNVGTLNLPEGSVVAWSETLCQHALPTGLTTVDATTRFPGSSAVAHLGSTAMQGCHLHRRR